MDLTSFEFLLFYPPPPPPPCCSLVVQDSTILSEMARVYCPLLKTPHEGWFLMCLRPSPDLAYAHPSWLFSLCSSRQVSSLPLCHTKLLSPWPWGFLLDCLRCPVSPFVFQCFTQIVVSVRDPPSRPPLCSASCQALIHASFLPCMVTPPRIKLPEDGCLSH